MEDELESFGFERKIFFFRIAHFDEVALQLPRAMERIENLPFTEGGRYQFDPTTNSRLLGYPDSLEYPLKFRFGRTRTNQLPDIEEAGKLSSLEISDDAGLIDVFHMIVFEDGHVVAEFNHDGPRIAKVGRYLFDKGGSLATAPIFLPLYERDIVGVIEALDNVSMLKLSVPPSAADLLRQADEDIYVAIEGGVRAGGGKTVELKLVGERTESKLKSLALRIARLISQSPHERERINAASVDGYSGGQKISRILDLLEDKLVTSSIFERNNPRSRSVKTLIAYEILEKAYIDKKDDLAYAAVSL